MAKYVMAMDQGTTSSRSIIFDKNGTPIESMNKEFEQIYPKLGWVEHRPLDIWNTQMETAKTILRRANVDPSDIAAIGVTRFMGRHAVQHKENFLPNKIRSALLLPANLGSQAGPLLAIFGLMMQSSMGDMLLQIGIILFGASVLFFLVTLPVEFDASRRALAMIRETGVLTAEELKGARSVLRAAALTYVASALTAVLYLLRYIGLANSRRRR